MEDESLINSVNTRQKSLIDRFNAVLTVFFVLGIGSLLPWNFFMNAKQYFMYKLRDTAVNSSESWLNASYYVDNQRSYESYLAVSAMVPTIVFMFVNIAISKRVKVETRILTSLALMSFMFLLTVIITQINTDHSQLDPSGCWSTAVQCCCSDPNAGQQLFLTLSLTSVSIMNAGSGVLQGASCGLASYFPSKYMQAVMTGQALGGVVASIASIITLWLGSGPVRTGFAYFLIALAVTLGSLLIFLLLMRLRYYRHHVTDVTNTQSSYYSYAVNDSQSDLSGDDADNDIIVDNQVASDNGVRSTDYLALKSVMKKIWIDALIVFFVFMVTLSCFPGVGSLIQSVSPVSTWTRVYFTPVTCFLLFNVSDVIGRTVCGIVLWPRQSNRGVLILLSVLRVGLLPLFLLSNINIPDRHLPLMLPSDAAPIAAECLLGFSNGYLITLTMMYAPRRVKAEDSEVAGAVMSFFLACGLGAGAGISVILVKFVV